jgi:dihydrofolate reductase
MIFLIAAKDKNNVIGINNSIPWHLPDDLKRFKKITDGNTVIMGRKTFESIGKPLPNRFNIVISKTLKQKNFNNIIVCNSLSSAILKSPINKKIFIIGGEKIYKEAMEKNIIDYMYITEILDSFEGDSYFPEIEENNFKLVSFEEIQVCNKTGIKYQYKNYQKLIPI